MMYVPPDKIYLPFDAYNLEYRSTVFKGRPSALFHLLILASIILYLT